MRAVEGWGLAIALLVVGCAGTSTLVDPHDRLFDAAQDRLVATARRPDVQAAPAAERALFMQAEGLYLYRFAPPARGGMSYLAQGAAVLTDFPAFQALAGSLDLSDLRLRACDGAVQLWETLLVRRPDTLLRPLVLYRLGWAYRSAGAAGLPRATGDQALETLVREDPSSPLAWLAGEARRVPWKSKNTATELSVIPGLGQFYVGERLNGAGHLAVALAALAMVAVPVVIAYDRRQDLGWRRDWPLLVTGVAGLVILSFDYTAAYQDALRGVVDFNERAERDFRAAHPEAP